MTFPLFYMRKKIIDFIKIVMCENMVIDDQVLIRNRAYCLPKIEAQNLIYRKKAMIVPYRVMRRNLERKILKQFENKTDIVPSA